MIPENDWYGHKTLLAEYGGFRADRAFFGLMCHGWELDMAPGVGFRRLSFAPYFVWNERHLAQARTRGVPNVHCIGAPFSYLVRGSLLQARESNGEGTFLTPAHSSEGTISYPVHEFISDIRNSLPGPYTVSIYYQDLDSPHVDAYRDAGFRVVSFGRRMRQSFLTDMANEMLAHQFVASNVVQTSLWYGALLGRTVRVIGRGAFPIAPGQDPEAARMRWPQFFESGVSRVDTIALAEVELGYSAVASPSDLRSALSVDSYLKLPVATAIRRRIDRRFSTAAATSGHAADGLDGGPPIVA